MNRIQGQLSPNFHREEFKCKCGCGFDIVDAELIIMLETIRAACKGAPITITSGCRCPEHNKKIGGSEHSYHVIGKAADFKVKGYKPSWVANKLDAIAPESYGLGRYNNWTHIDVRNGKGRWDKT